MASPTFLVQIHLDGSFRDVTADVRAININVGRQRVLDTFTAGTARIALNNDDAKYGPLSGGTYSDAQWINSEVRVLVYLNSAAQPTPLFRGLCDDIDVVFPDSKSSVLQVKASDGLSKLARTELVDDINGVTGNATFAEQVGSARFTAVLDNAQVDYPDESSPVDRAVDTSEVTMAAETVARLQTSTYRGNVLTYKKRFASSTATGLTFGGTSGAESQRPDFTKTTVQFGSELLYTRGIYAGSTGDDQTYDENVIGQPAYGIRTIVRRNLLNLNNADVLAACKNFVALHSTPVLRISSMDCKPRAMTDAQAEKVAKLGVWDGVSIQFQPAGASVALLETVRIEGVRHDITPGDWTMRLTTSGSGASQFFILDSTIDGLLDENKLAP